MRLLSQRTKYIVIPLKLCLDLLIIKPRPARSIDCDYILIASFRGEFDDAIRFEYDNHRERILSRA